jgi:hypothetical protein
MLRRMLITRPALKSATLCSIAAGLASATAASAHITNYRTCPHDPHSMIRAVPSISCAHGVQIAEKGLSTDGDDGERFTLYGHKWQCVPITHPNHGKWTLFGCFVGYAPHNTDQPQFRALAKVTVLVHFTGD